MAYAVARAMEDKGAHGELAYSMGGARTGQDIAFRIVNREWEQSHRRGFRCTFDRGILFLHFRFKRYRYRK